MHYQFREFTFCFRITINSLSFSWINNLFGKLTMNSFLFSQFTLNLLSFLRIRYKFTMKLLSLTRIYYESTIFVANSLCFLYIWREFPFFFRSHYEFAIFFANSLWIDYLCRELTSFVKNLKWIYYLGFYVIFSWLLRFVFTFQLTLHFRYRKLTIFFANSLQFQFTYEFTIWIAMSFLCRKFNIYSQYLWW